MDILYALAKIIIIGYVLCYLGQEFYRFRHNLRFIWTVWSRFRIGMFLQTLVMLLLVMIFITILIEVPIIKYGWFNFFHRVPEILSSRRYLKAPRPRSRPYAFSRRYSFPYFFSRFRSLRTTKNDISGKATPTGGR